jgi:hypothetical protein
MYYLVDFKTAYNSIDRTRVFKAMKEFNAHRKLTYLVELTLQTVRCRVKALNAICELSQT